MLWKTIEQSEGYWEKMVIRVVRRALVKEVTFEQKLERNEGISHADLGVFPNQGARRWPVGLERIKEGGTGLETRATGGY